MRKHTRLPLYPTPALALFSAIRKEVRCSQHAVALLVWTIGTVAAGAADVVLGLFHFWSHGLFYHHQMCEYAPYK